MTDIQKMIEEEAIRYCKNNLQVVTLHDKMEIFEAGANFALSQFQHANRWRKVSEELPEVRKDHYFINIKKSGARIDTIAILSGVVDVKEYLEFYDVTQWKPIE